MIKLDAELLERLGLADLGPEDSNSLLHQIYETLEMRVGMALAVTFDNEELDAFEGFIDGGDEAGALNWLESNHPEYRQVVQAEFRVLCEEVASAAPAILEAALDAPEAGAA